MQLLRSCALLLAAIVVAQATTATDFLCEVVPEDTVGVVERPTVFTLGAQKAGTDYLFHLLRQHPSITPLKKLGTNRVVREAHVLDNSAPVTDAHLDQYSGTNSTGQGYVLDATPCYMDNPRAPCRVHRYFKKPKFIITLRDPVARAMSAWIMVQRNPFFHDPSTKRWHGLPTLREEARREITYLEFERNCSISTGTPAGSKSWAECMEGHIPFHLCNAQYGKDAGCMFGFVYKGLYARQLQFWFTLFPPESFHIVSFTDLVQNPKQVMDEVVRFLGLPPHNSWVNPAFAKHAYLSLAERSRMCRDSELRHAWTYLSAYFKRPQLELQALLERYGWAGKLQGLFWPEQDCSKVAAQALGNSMGAA